MKRKSLVECLDLAHVNSQTINFKYKNASTPPSKRKTYRRLSSSNMILHIKSEKDEEMQLKAGIVYKHTHRMFIGAWKQRYARLSKTALYIYKSVEGRMSVKIPLTSICKVYIAQNKNKKRFPFNIELDNELLQLACNTEEECRSWVLSISNTVFHCKTQKDVNRLRADTFVSSLQLSNETLNENDFKLTSLEQILNNPKVSKDFLDFCQNLPCKTGEIHPSVAMLQFINEVDNFMESDNMISKRLEMALHIYHFWVHHDGVMSKKLNLPPVIVEEITNKIHSSPIDSIVRDAKIPLYLSARKCVLNRLKTSAFDSYLEDKMPTEAYFDEETVKSLDDSIYRRSSVGLRIVLSNEESTIQSKASSDEIVYSDLIDPLKDRSLKRVMYSIVRSVVDITIDDESNIAMSTINESKNNNNNNNNKDNNNKDNNKSVIPAVKKLAMAADATFVSTGFQDDNGITRRDKRKQRKKTHTRFASQQIFNMQSIRSIKSQIPSPFFPSNDNISVASLLSLVISRHKFILNFILEHWCLPMDEQVGPTGFRRELRLLRLSINRWHTNEYKSFLRCILGVLQDSDEGARDLALRVLYLALYKHNHHDNEHDKKSRRGTVINRRLTYETSLSKTDGNNYNIANDGLAQLKCNWCHKTGRQFQYYVITHCSGDKYFTPAIKDSLLTILLTNRNQLHTHEAPRTRVALFGSSVHNVHIWSSVWNILHNADLEMCREMVGDISTLCVRSHWNMISIVKQNDWISWIAPLLYTNNDMIKNFKKDPSVKLPKAHIDSLPLTDQIYRYSLNAIVMYVYIAFERCTLSDIVVELNTEIVCCIQELWKNSIESLYLVQRFFSALFHKMSSKINLIISDDDKNIFMNNFLAFSDLMRTYFFCTPTFGYNNSNNNNSNNSNNNNNNNSNNLNDNLNKKDNNNEQKLFDEQRDRGLTKSLRFGDVASFGPHIINNNEQIIFADTSLLNEYYNLLYSIKIALSKEHVQGDEPTEHEIKIHEKVSFYSDAISFLAMLQVSFDSLKDNEVSNLCEEFIASRAIDRTSLFKRLNDKVLLTRSPAKHRKVQSDLVLKTFKNRVDSFSLKTTSTSSSSLMTVINTKDKNISASPQVSPANWSNLSITFGTNPLFRLPSIGESEDESKNKQQDHWLSVSPLNVFASITSSNAFTFVSSPSNE